jgi:hypothetical protein
MMLPCRRAVRVLRLPAMLIWACCVRWGCRDAAAVGLRALQPLALPAALLVPFHEHRRRARFGSS